MNSLQEVVPGVPLGAAGLTLARHYAGMNQCASCGSTSPTYTMVSSMNT